MSRVIPSVLAVLLLIGVVPAQAAQFHVINGQPADPGEYPAMAAIVFTSNQFQFCGGTLVAPGWVMTAAHCFADGPPADQVEVVLDTTNWTVPGEVVAVDAVSIHPDYDPNLSTTDIAMLRLVAPAVTPPAALVERGQGSLYLSGQPAVATGYGTTTPRGENPSEDLLEVALPVVGDQACDDAYQGGIVADLHVCAGAPGTEADPGPDTCQGDSGGPLWADPGDGVLRVIGVTSFGGLCGVERPGVYTEVISLLDWVEGTIDGSVPLNTPVVSGPVTPPPVAGGASSPPLRITFDDSGVSESQLQAVAISQQTFGNRTAPLAVVATSASFPDALGGSTLAYGVGPLLFTDPAGRLADPTVDELRRTLAPDAEVYLLGGTAAIPEATADELVGLGFAVTRLAGAGREQTALAVAEEVIDRQGVLPRDTVILATAGNWPDAVAVGQIGSRWGVPILLTPADRLGEAAEAFLSQRLPAHVLVAGGETAIGPAVVAQVEAITGPATVRRLGGATRFETAAEVARSNVEDFHRANAPRLVVAVNLRREQDAFAHVLAASMITGAVGGVIAPVEGATGTDVPQPVLDAVCGLDVRVIIAGAVDLVGEAPAQALAAASGGEGCDPISVLELGDSVHGAVNEAQPSRPYAFLGRAGQEIRIRVDAQVEGPSALDPIVRLVAPSGVEVGRNDDSPEETGLDSLLVATLTEDGAYLIEATGYQGSTGTYKVSVDPPPAFTIADRLDQPVAPSTLPVTGVPGARVVVEMRALADFVDPVLEAMTTGGRTIATDDDGGGYPNSRLDVRIPADGQLEILPGMIPGSGGAYRLSIYDPEGQLSFG